MSILRSGNLDRLVDLLEYMPGEDDGYGEGPGEWSAFETRWCSVKPKMGREAVNAAGRDGLRVMSFWFRWDSVTASLTEAHGLLFDGQRYELTAPPIEIGRRDGIEVLAVAAALEQDVVA